MTDIDEYLNYVDEFLNQTNIEQNDEFESVQEALEHIMEETDTDEEDVKRLQEMKEKLGE